ncbi:amino acid dehydrogenase [Fulvitalea axinellae]|uniref:Amino acid dehydrogenase n=1 Tax=Fulvitalea axinellae TaxID=1182444 RepID=A0AAU9CLQ3_9BACT|nr:amino acid dehydrogenase [Fulvitalea axinellae]
MQNEETTYREAGTDDVNGMIRSFEEKRPSIVFEWNDTETEAQGWVVINSLRGGAAGGGTRMRKGLDKHEVVSLAKTMEVKFTVSGPAIGGAKSGINFDPNDPRKEGVLHRWYKAVTPLLKNYYGTGGDLNVDEVAEVIPITENYGLWHPQEGIVNGHHRADEPDKIRLLGQLRLGVKKVIEDTYLSPDVKRKFNVSDMITGYGVAESVKHYYHIWGGDLERKRAVIQGWGNVAASAAYYLAQSGVKIVGILDKDHGIVKPEGLDFEEVRRLFLLKKGNKLNSEAMVSREQAQKDLNHTDAEIFIPAAASRLVSKEDIQKMADRKLELISCGANVPFADKEIFFGEISRYADNTSAVIPDFIANCGMAKTFDYLMRHPADLTDQGIFKATSEAIRKALLKVNEINPDKCGLTASAFRISLADLI